MSPTPAHTRLFRLSTALAALLALAPPARAVEDVEVTVVAILATTDKGAKVQPEVAAIAKQVQKKYPDLTGFRLAQMTCQPMTVGKAETFPLVDKEVATVTVEEPADKHDRVCLRVKPPGVKEITYTSCCGKFFPIVTRYHTKDQQERLITAVMVGTCKEK
jgi:hypothetical protein